MAKYAWRGFLAEGAGLPDTPRPEDPSEALRCAAAAGDQAALVCARARGGDARWKDAADRGRTALHAATAAGMADCVAFLVLNGGDVGDVDDDEATALCLASASDAAVEVAQIILEVEQGELW